MKLARVLIEIIHEEAEGFAKYRAALESPRESESQTNKLLHGLAGFHLEADPTFAPLPMFLEEAPQAPRKTARSGAKKGSREALATFAAREESSDLMATSVVLSAEIDASKVSKLAGSKGVRVYPASPMRLAACGCGSSRMGVVSALDVQGADYLLAAEDMDVMDLSPTAGGTDCRPFRPAVAMSTIRRLLGARRVWDQGYRGQNVIVAVVDEGIHGGRYPVIGGYEPSSDEEPSPGSADITSHGSMCAADILVAAPWARLLDYPLLAEATSADGVRMFQAILERRRLNGTPQVVNNSYGFYSVPSQALSPNHEAWDINHPFNRKVREVIASGAAVFFAAGNCGSDCPSGNCRASATGPGKSINAAAAMAETFTIGAVNSRHERVGYSSQGPSLAATGFEPNKPDFAAYTHFFGNFGSGRPGGLAMPFDNGTSAATPVAAGVAALLLSAFPTLSPNRLRQAFRAGAVEIGNPGWDPLHGHGVINAAASYQWIRDNGP